MSTAAIATLILHYRYWILIPLTFIEGPIIGFIAGALARLGYFDPFVAFSIFIVRDVLVDNFWYTVGRRSGKTAFARKILDRIKVTPEHLQSVRRLWDEHGFRTMLVAKLSYGVAQAFLLVAGIVDMPFWEYFKYALGVALVEYGGLFVAGYLIGGAFGNITGIISNIQWVIAILALVVAGYYIFTHWMRTRAEEEIEEVD